MHKKQWLFLLVPILLLLSLVSCSNEEEKTEASIKTEEVLLRPVQPAFEVEGTYKGTLPCASCPGIRSTVIFTKEGKVEKTDLYTDKDENSFSSTGNWEMETPNQIKVSYSDQVDYYSLLSDNEIELLGPNKEQSAPPAAGLNYKLKKESRIKQPSKLNGIYILQMEGGYSQQLSIQEEGSGQFAVNIKNSPVSQTGCSFSGRGKFVNNRIEVTLSTLESSLKGVLTIDLIGDSARVFTATEAQRYDLMFFCAGGTSLAGYYIKQ